MAEFENKKYLNLKEVDKDDVGKNVLAILAPAEEVLGVYKSGRDYLVFTDKRFLTVNVQGVTGKKQCIMCIPYKAITTFTIQTAAVIDLDSELEVYVSPLGSVLFEFSGRSSIVRIGQMMSACMFGR